MEIFSLKNKVAIVTGAIGLLGKEHCKALSEAGANVIVVDLNEEECKEFAKSLPTESMGIYADVTNPESIKNLRDKVIEKFGRIDVLVNNAAINDMFENPKAALEQSKFENYPLELWQKSVDVNLTGVFLCSQIIGSVMAKQKSGSIINIASTYGIVAPDQSLYQDKDGKQIFYKPPAYSATKGAIIMFTKYLAAYWGNSGVRVNTLTPGGVENFQDEFFIEQYSKRTMLKRMAKPTDYKGALIFLASDASAYMTGANLIVDGGWTAW
ncbi:SDR family oxidoreductase [Rosettibacter firmus]|uniref:SDR family oxidoreductase n=1 Tax=Rosettibacter firmus TaxID=3111522 RepID=UPI00336BC969